MLEEENRDIEYEIKPRLKEIYWRLRIMVKQNKKVKKSEVCLRGGGTMRDVERKRILLPLLITIMFFGLVGIAYAFGGAITANVFETPAVGEVKINFTMNSGSQGNLTNMTAFVRSAKTGNSTLIRYANLSDLTGNNGSDQCWVNGTGAAIASKGCTISINTTTLVDSNDYSVIVQAIDSNASALVQGASVNSSAVNFTINNTNPKVVQISGFGSNAPNSGTVYFLIGNATGYEIRDGATAYVANALITGSFDNANTSGIILFRESGNFTIKANDGSEFVEFDSPGYSKAGKSTTQKMIEKGEIVVQKTDETAVGAKLRERWSLKMILFLAFFVLVIALFWKKFK